MKLFQKLIILSLLALSSSCAMMFNKENVDVTINSNPQGADIFIGGVNYGKTPKTINIKPKDYNVVLAKEGYGTAQIKLESWRAIRHNKAEGRRCLADAVGTMFLIPYYSFYWSGKCLDFKKNEYIGAIPYTGYQKRSISQRSNESDYYDRQNNYYTQY